MLNNGVGEVSFLLEGRNMYHSGARWLLWSQCWLYLSLALRFLIGDGVWGQAQTCPQPGVCGGQRQDGCTRGAAVRVSVPPGLGSG